MRLSSHQSSARTRFVLQKLTFEPPELRMSSQKKVVDSFAWSEPHVQQRQHVRISRTPTSKSDDSYEDGDVDAHGAWARARFPASRIANPLKTTQRRKTQMGQRRARFPPTNTTKCARGFGESAIGHHPHEAKSMKFAMFQGTEKSKSTHFSSKHVRTARGIAGAKRSPREQLNLTPIYPGHKNPGCWHTIWGMNTLQFET